MYHIQLQCTYSAGRNGGKVKGGFFHIIIKNTTALAVLAVPALLALGLWIVFQIINGMGALGGSEAGGVAYAAHIGGFFAGLLLIKFFEPRAQPAVETSRYNKRYR